MRKTLIFALALIGFVSCGTNNSEKTSKTMTYQELVASRYSCKKFAPKQISSEQLNAILEAGRLAPSAESLLRRQ